MCATDLFWIEWTESMWGDMVALLYHNRKACGSQYFL